MKIYTIGFTQKSAAEFFEALKSVGARRLVDVRLSNKSQLAGFANARDLPFYLQNTRGLPPMEYDHRPELAPTKEILDAYRAVPLTRKAAEQKSAAWATYERDFRALMQEREIEGLDRGAIADAVLLCSEHEPERCHRRLVAEYLREHWGDVDILHLPVGVSGC